MLRDGDWNFVRHRHDIDELYDLTGDPDEMINLATSDPMRVDVMRRTIAETISTTGPEPYAWALNMDSMHA